MDNIIVVSALNKYVRSLLESDPVLTDIAIRGEISNFNRHYKTGHCYFNLKDEKSGVKAVMFRSDADRLAFQPENGLAVIARGRISLFERDGTFQLYVEDLFPDGLGAAQLAFEQLKQRLEAEGLFRPEHKKPLPAYPRRVGLVTSKTGAALQDVLKVAAGRCATAQFVLAPVTVQGLTAGGEIADAIHKLDASNLVDVIIVTRGGGAAEDLWVFNAEPVARAAFACQTPLVSAIGHETDVTILDFVADCRAPTPSAAAETVLPDLGHVHHTMSILFRNIADNIHNQLDSCYNKWDTVVCHPALQALREKPVRELGRLLSLETVLRKEAARKLAGAQQRMRAAATAAAGLNPYVQLARGYTLARDGAGRVISSAAAACEGQRLRLEMQDGELGCLVEEVLLTPNSEKREDSKPQP